jgi:mRNA interferase RelE/StbE
MSFRVLIPKAVQKQIDRLPENVRLRIIEKVLILKENPRPPGCVKLRAHENEYRIRIGAYRLRYEISEEKSTVVLLHCGHCKDVYR